MGEIQLGQEVQTALYVAWLTILLFIVFTSVFTGGAGLYFLSGMILASWKFMIVKINTWKPVFNDLWFPDSSILFRKRDFLVLTWQGLRPCISQPEEWSSALPLIPPGILGDVCLSAKAPELVEISDSPEEWMENKVAGAEGERLCICEPEAHLTVLAPDVSKMPPLCCG